MFDSLNSELTLDSRDFVKSAGSAENAMAGLQGKAASVGSSMQSLGKTLTLGVTLPLLAVGAGAIKTASDVEEMQAKMSVVFGDQTADIKAWSETFAAETNRSKFALQGFASTIQDTFVPLGFARDEAAEMSTQVAELAVDLASFNNTSEDQALNALQSALVGNHETMRQFGVVITQATLDQELLTMGIQGGVQAATEQQKAMARLNIIMASTTDAQGDAARTSGSFANQMRGLKATTQETAAEFGQHLLPIATEVVGIAQSGVRWFGNLTERQQKTAIALAAVAAAAGPVLAVGGTFLAMLPAMATGWGMVTGAAGSFAATNVGAVIPSIVGVQLASAPLLPILLALAAGAALLYGAWETNFLGIQQRVGGFGETVSNVVGWVRNNLHLLKRGFLLALGPIGWFAIAYEENLFGIKDTTDMVFGEIVGGVQWLIDQILKIPEALKDLLDRIPGIDGDEVAETLFPPKPVSERSEEIGVEAAESMSAGEEKARLIGQQTGEEYVGGLQAGVQHAVAAIGEIRGEMTPEIREALEAGVAGYVSDPSKIQDAATVINEELFHAVAQTATGATAASLGVSDEEFAVLMQRFGGGSSSVSPSDFSTSSTTTTSTGTTSSSGGVSVDSISAAIRDALTGLAVRIDTDDEALRQWVVENAEVVVEREIQKEARKSKRRGIKSSYSG